VLGDAQRNVTKNEMQAEYALRSKMKMKNCDTTRTLTHSPQDRTEFYKK
jgi:hypothetical protein